MKPISVWKLPRRKTTWRRLLFAGSDSIIINTFHHSGFSKVIFGVTSWHRGCSETNFSVQKVHVVLLELMSIIRGKITEDWPGWQPRWANCIMPNQAGHDTTNRSDVSRSTSRLVEILYCYFFFNFERYKPQSRTKIVGTLDAKPFFPSRASLFPPNVVYFDSVTKSCTPTLRGREDTKMSQQFWLRLQIPQKIC